MSAYWDVLQNVGGQGRKWRKQKIHSSILGKSDGVPRCRLVTRLCLGFAAGEDPVTVINGILAGKGYSSPEQLRGAFSLPAGRLICRPAGKIIRGVYLRVKTADRDKVLEQALLLGLCTSQIFDPARPVLWTTVSLTRALELFDPAGFYL
ncbi:MAG: hypothetical protein WCK75_05185 [Elusimicrobiota bacterium]